MNINEDHFQLSKKGHTHVLSDRIKFDWKEVMVLPLIILLPMGFWVDWFIGSILALLSGVGYALYRFAASKKYTEIHINEQSGNVIQLQRLKDKIVEKQFITEQFDPSQIEFRELTRNGRTKFILVYKSHKEYDLLMLKTERDKHTVEDYLRTIAVLEP